MLISKAMNTKLNDQVANELAASQAYLAMSCMFEELGLKALAGHFRRQSDEERGHALKFVDYVLEVGGKVKIGALAPPKGDFPTPKAAIDAALKHELKVTGDINDLMALAEKERDYASRSFLQWFVNEQVEEVSSMDHLLRIAEMAGVNLLQLESYVRHMLTPKS